MKFIKTDFDNAPKETGFSSWIIYITKTREEAQAVYNMASTQKAIHGGDWRYNVSMNEVLKDCRFPHFLHDRGYWMVAIDHNNGDWSIKPTYTLFLVE